MMIAGAMALLIAMLLTVARAVMGPSVFDRILAVNAYGTLIALLIAVHGFLNERPEFLDIALLYALINFISVIAVTRYVETSGLGQIEDRPDGADVQ